MKKDYKHPRFKAVELKAERLLDGTSAIGEARGSVNGGSSVYAAPSTDDFFGLEKEDANENNFDFD